MDLLILFIVFAFGVFMGGIYVSDKAHREIFRLEAENYRLKYGVSSTEARQHEEDEANKVRLHNWQRKNGVI